MKEHLNIQGVDIFCGIGGLSHGLIQTGIRLKAGYDIDASCKYAFESNNDAPFYCRDVSTLTGEEINWHFRGNHQVRVVVGCAPCQPFSTHSYKVKEKKKDSRWGLLGSFARLVEEVEPDIVSMENVPNLKRQDIFEEFVAKLWQLNYHVNHSILYCPDYGIPQKRSRLVLLASKHGSIDLPEKTHLLENYLTTKDAIGELESLEAGQLSEKDPIHRTQGFTAINLKRIRHSTPNGTWRDWPVELRLPCHRKKTGKTYPSVYGRMSWDEPSPTITTQFYNYGTGRFGHPSQDRGLSLREGALLQTFPEKYRFVATKKEISISRIAKHIGNAVPVRLGEVIGHAIIAHVKETKCYE